MDFPLWCAFPQLQPPLYNAQQGVLDRWRHELPAGPGHTISMERCCPD